MLLPIHIAAGGLAIILGTVALVAKKGGMIHRRGGMLFVYAMITMSTSAAILAYPKAPGNVIAAFMTTYFVVTAVTTVRAVSPWTHTLNIAALTIAVSVATIDIASGIVAYNTPSHFLGGVPFVMFFFIATVLLLAASGDVRMMRRGALRGGARLARHLWRMCFALFIAAGSFFSIRERVAKILPEPFTTGPMRALPIVLLFVTMFYWLWRVRSSRTFVRGQLSAGQSL